MSLFLTRRQMAALLAAAPIPALPLGPAMAQSALDIKRGFARIVASRDRPAGIDADYLIGVAVWWFVAFAAGSIAGFSVWPAAIVASLACWFWPVILLFDRGDRR